MSNKKIAYKGFDDNWQCRGFQYEVGKSYKHDGDVEICSSGFHACEYPLDVFSYYMPTSNFAIVEMGDPTTSNEGDTKIASARITIQAEISLNEMVTKSIDWVMSKIKTENKENENQSAASNTGNYSAASNTGNYSAASNTGNYSAASNTGYQSAASNTGDYSAASNTGNYSAASNTGYQSAASNTGNYSAASNTGNQSAASNTGYQSAASNTGNQSAASNTGNYSAASNTGDYSAASNTGDYSAASNTGNQSAASVQGKNSVAIAIGCESKAKASKSSAIVLCYRNDKGELIHIRSSKVGDNGIKADTWYMLDSKAEFIEVANENH